MPIKIFKGDFTINLMKRGWGIVLVIAFIFATCFVISLPSTSPILNDLHLNIQTTNSSGNVINGTFSFVFSISTTSDCSNIIYTNSTNLTTDSNGGISYYLSNLSLNFLYQYWLCYYRNGVLINASEISQVPYAFMARNVSLSGVYVDTNFGIGSYNITTTGMICLGGVCQSSWPVAGGNWFNQQLNTTSSVFFASLNIANNLYANSTNVGIVTITPTQKLDVNGNVNITGNLYVGGVQITNSVPSGMISPFNLSSCPVGWNLANGSNGTPDLRGIFVRGSGVNGILQYANSTYGGINATYGTYQNDSLQGHYINGALGNAGASVNLFPGNNAGGNVNLPITFVTDGTNGIPRTGKETTPAYYATIYCVKT